MHFLGLCVFLYLLGEVGAVFWAYIVVIIIFQVVEAKVFLGWSIEGDREHVFRGGGDHTNEIVRSPHSPD